MRQSKLALLALSFAILLSAEALGAGTGAGPAPGGGPSATPSQQGSPAASANSSPASPARGGLISSVNSSTAASLESEGLSVSNAGNLTVIGVSRNSTVRINPSNVSTANSVIAAGAVAVQLNSSNRNITIASASSGGGASPSAGAAGGGAAGGENKVTITSVSASGIAVRVTTNAEVTVRNGSVFPAGSATAISVYPSDLAPAPLPSQVTVRLALANANQLEYEYSAATQYASGEPLVSLNNSFTASFRPGSNAFTVNSTNLRFTNVSAPVQIRARNRSLLVRMAAASLNLTDGPATAEVSSPLLARDNALYANGSQLNVLPQDLAQRVRARSSAEPENVSLSASAGAPAQYSFQVTKRYGLLAVFPVPVTLRARVDAENGVITEVESEPWWSPLATNRANLRAGETLPAG